MEQLEDTVITALEESSEVVALLPKKVRPRQKPEHQYKEDDGVMPTIKEPHNSNYEPVEEDKDSRAGSATFSMSFMSVKTMIRDSLNALRLSLTRLQPRSRRIICQQGT